ncbi:MAG: N-acetylglucosamine-6-phosphate deacetylase, partial [Oscillospiraceae bacterium]
MLIKNAKVLTDDFKFSDVDVRIENGKIAEIGKNISGEDVIDANGQYLVPGFIDVHTHGCVGFDGCDGDIDGYEKMSEFYASKGVTSFLLTTMTLAKSQLCDILSKISKFIDSEQGLSYSHGVYLEGPFINPVKKGAQAGEFIIKPDFKDFEEMNTAANGKIKVVVVAPEVEGIDFIKQASKVCSVSIAHTSASYETAIEAINSGVTDITHLFNAMPPFHHREPGVIGAAFDSNVFMEMICDGIHLHPSIIRTTFKVDSDRVVLISDSMRAAGMPDGDYSLGGQAVMVHDNKALLADGTLAGSVSNINDCV